jgi:hypothetical protein
LPTFKLLAAAAVLARVDAGKEHLELVERRAETKGSANQQSTCRTQSRVSVSQALERIRQAIRFPGERAQQPDSLDGQLGCSNDDLPHVLHGPLKRAELEQGDDFSGLALVDGIVRRGPGV